MRGSQTVGRVRGEARDALTRRCRLEHALDPGRQLDDVVGWSRPEDEAVPLVLEARLEGGVLQPQEVRVDDELLEVGRQELFSLLLVALGAVRRVEGLDLGLLMFQSLYSQRGECQNGMAAGRCGCPLIHWAGRE